MKEYVCGRTLFYSASVSDVMVRCKDVRYAILLTIISEKSSNFYRENPRNVLIIVNL